MRQKLNLINFLKRAQEIHGSKYDYSRIELKSTKDKIIVICPEHGEFNQSVNNHLRGQNCPSCGQESRTTTQRNTKEEFVVLAEAVHGKKYDYTNAFYINSQSKVNIQCPIHGIFSMKPNSHVAGKQGCPKCGRIEANKSLTLDWSEFIKRAEVIHGDKYEYLPQSYKKYTEQIEIICKTHGLFFQTPHSHISMRAGCPICGAIQAGQSNQKGWSIVRDLFIAAHGDRYQYDETSFINVTTKALIKCSKHGWFKQMPYHHYAGSGCQKCAIEELHENQKITFEDFVIRANAKHHSRYTYDKYTFKDIFTPMKITCAKHDYFLQAPVNHYKGAGCPKCSSSKGEALVRDILTKNRLEFEEQKKFPDLKYIANLRCDFYLPLHNLVIEYNGIQHYEALEIFGGLSGLESTIKRDNAKRKFLKESNISILEIPYFIKDIEALILDWVDQNKQ